MGGVVENGWLGLNEWFLFEREVINWSCFFVYNLGYLPSNNNKQYVQFCFPFILGAKIKRSNSTPSQPSTPEPRSLDSSV